MMKTVGVAVVALLVISSMVVPTLWASAQQQQEPKIVDILERMVSGLQRAIQALEERGASSTVLEFFQQALQRAQEALEKAEAGDIEGARAGLREASIDIWLGLKELRPSLLNETVVCGRLLNFTQRLQGMTSAITNSTIREEVELELSDILERLQSGNLTQQELVEIRHELKGIGMLIHREMAKHRVLERVKQAFGNMTDEEAMEIALAMMPAKKVTGFMKHMKWKGRMFIRRALSEDRKQEVYDRMLEKATRLLNHVKDDVNKLEDGPLKERVQALISDAESLIGSAMQEEEFEPAIVKLTKAMGVLIWAHRLAHHGLS